MGGARRAPPNPPRFGPGVNPGPPRVPGDQRSEEVRMPVLYEKRDHIGVVTTSSPQARTAWAPDFNEGLARHFAAMEDDDEIRCAVLTGDESGGAFSAGANLKDPRTHTQDSAAEFIK